MSSPYGAFCSDEEENRKRTIPDRVLIRRVYDYAHAHRRNLIIGVLATFLGALTGLVAPYMHAIAIDSIIIPKDLIRIPVVDSPVRGDHLGQLRVPIHPDIPDANHG